MINLYVIKYLLIGSLKDSSLSKKIFFGTVLEINSSND